MNILIAEDCPVLQTLHGELMGTWGYDFDIVSNGLEAIEQAKKNQGKYDLCIMDVEMPVMNGIDATKLMRKTMNYFPIMAYSSNYELKRQCLEAGMDEFTEKPCPSNMLFKKIYELTVKSIIWVLKDDELVLKKETPMNAEHAKELQALRKKGLTKLSIHGVGGEFVFVVDERVQNKISNDFIGKEQEVSEFLDRSEEKPGLCHLYKGTFMVNTKYLLPEELEKLREREDIALTECDGAVLNSSGNS